MKIIEYSRNNDEYSYQFCPNIGVKYRDAPQCGVYPLRKHKTCKKDRWHSNLLILHHKLDLFGIYIASGHCTS